MSDSLALDVSPLREDKASKPTTGLAAMFKAAMESLVAAQRPRFENTDPLLYRFPPL